VLGKSTVKRGKAVIMKIGDAEVEVDPKFRLYLQVCVCHGQQLAAKAMWTHVEHGLASDSL
jgi:hypothetical protein